VAAAEFSTGAARYNFSLAAGVGIALTLAEVKLIPPTPCAAK
jgi:hypothetical protein